MYVYFPHHLCAGQSLCGADGLNKFTPYIHLLYSMDYKEGFLWGSKYEWKTSVSTHPITANSIYTTISNVVYCGNGIFITPTASPRTLALPVLPS
mmetsp:Transcript_96820/g.166950  ORF Transcript_96820/g.166950 Transcript_96820/m.166950 type:complete len:95 (+) Transcript_96820:744-1028(+)